MYQKRTYETMLMLFILTSPLLPADYEAGADRAARAVESPTITDRLQQLLGLTHKSRALDDEAEQMIAQRTTPPVRLTERFNNFVDKYLGGRNYIKKLTPEQIRQQAAEIAKDSKSVNALTSQQLNALDANTIKKLLTTPTTADMRQNAQFEGNKIYQAARSADTAAAAARLKTIASKITDPEKALQVYDVLAIPNVPSAKNLTQINFYKSLPETARSKIADPTPKSDRQSVTTKFSSWFNSLRTTARKMPAAKSEDIEMESRNPALNAAATPAATGDINDLMKQQEALSDISFAPKTVTPLAKTRLQKIRALLPGYTSRAP